jgi:hypothetical protein
LGGTLAITGAWTHVQADQGGALTCISYAKYDTGSGAVTVTLSAKNNRKHLHILESTGFNTTTPVNDSNTATGSSSSPTVSLTSVDTGNTVVGACTIAGAGLSTLSPDQGVEEYETSTLGPVLMSSMSDETSPGSTVSFTPDVTGGWVVAAIEINVAAEPNITDSFTDDLDNWLDSINLAIPELGDSFADDLDNWTDKAKFVWPLTLSFTDDLDNWLDSTPALTEIAIEITASEVPLWFKDNFEWDDTKNPDYTFTDDLNNWSEQTSVVLGLLDELADDLDAWLDSESHDLADAGATPLTESHADDLDNWNDSITLFVEYLPAFADDLDNWNDSIESFAEYFLTVSDDLDSWTDSIVLLHGLVVADDLDNWLDNEDHIRSSVLAFADNIRAPPFPDPADAYSALLGHLITESDALSLSDSTDLVLGQFLTFSDDLDSWTDSIDVQLGIGIAESDDLNTWLDSESHTSSYELAAADDLNAWSDAILLGYGLQIFDDLDNWLDNENHSVGGAAELPITKGSDLDSWSDSAKLRFRHFLTRTDDLNNWLDSHAKSLVGVLDYSLNDSVANWSDQLGRGDGQLHGDSITFSDGITRYMLHQMLESDAMSFSDSLQTELEYRLTLDDQFTLDDGVVVAIVYLSQFSDTLTLTDAYKLTIGYTLKKGDALTLSDAIKLLYSYQLSLTDTLTMNDGIELFGQILMTQSDAMSLSDFKELLLAHFLTFDDTMTFADGFQKFMDQPELQWEPSDTLTLSDALEMFMEMFMAQSDTMTLTDAASIAATLTDEFSDTLTLSDAYSMILAKLIAQSDILSMSDARQLFLEHLLSLSDSFSLTDAQVQLVGQLLAYSDTLTFTDAQQFLLSHLLNISDTLSLSDASSVSIERLLAESDTLTLSDQIQILLGYLVQVSDALSMSDGRNVDLGGVAVGEIQEGDTLTFSDSFAAILNHFLTKSDTLVISDGFQIVLSLLIADMADNLNNWADNIAQAYGFAFQPTDDFTLSDATLLGLRYLISKSDTMTPSDGISMLMLYFLSVSDVMTFTDASRLINGYLKALSDNADNWTDSIVPALGLTIDAGSDLDVWAQAIAMQLSYWVPIGDGLTLVDGTSRFAEYFLNRSDTLNISDVMVRVFGYLKTLSDDISNWLDSSQVSLLDINALYVSEASDLDAWNDSVSAVLGTIASIIKFTNEAFSKSRIIQEAISEVEWTSEDFDSSE